MNGKKILPYYLSPLDFNTYQEGMDGKINGKDIFPLHTGGGEADKISHNHKES